MDGSIWRAPRMGRIVGILCVALTAMAGSPAFARSTRYARKAHGKGWLLFLGLLVVAGGGVGYLYWTFRKESPAGTRAEFWAHLKGKAQALADKALTGEKEKEQEKEKEKAREDVKAKEDVKAAAPAKIAAAP